VGLIVSGDRPILLLIEFIIGRPLNVEKQLSVFDMVFDKVYATKKLKRR